LPTSVRPPDRARPQHGQDTGLRSRQPPRRMVHARLGGGSVG
jgi:hypothetical protein